MGKITFIAGAGIGFILGSKAGPAAYRQVEAKARQIVGRPEVQDAVNQAKSKVTDKLPTSASGNQETPSVAPPGDPQTGEAIAAVAPIAP